MSLLQAEEVKMTAHGHSKSNGHGKPKSNGKAEETPEIPLSTSLENKRKKRIDRRKSKVIEMLNAATSVREENIYLEAFERLDFIDTGKDTASNIEKVKYLVKSNGLQPDDPRIASAMQHCEDLERQGLDLTFDVFMKEFQPCFTMFRKLLENRFIFSDYDYNKKLAQKIFEEVKAMPNEGFIPDYIPALKDVNEDGFAVSICTVDGQIINLGDSDERTCLHAISGAISYMLAQQQLGEENLKQYIGAEHSGNQFNALELMSTGIPHNPLNCAGSLMSSSLIYKGESNAKKFEKYSQVVKKMIGNRKVLFNNEMYLSEIDNAHANYSLLYMMEEENTLPENTDIKKTLQFYTQCCALHLTIQDLGVLAATFANGGICPLTEERCFQDSNAVKLCLSQMLASGMNTNSGQWAFEIGLPTKSAISGATIMIVPNTCGIAVWSPKVNKFCNSHKGDIFLCKFVEAFEYNDIDHQYGAGVMKNTLMKKQMTSKIEHIHLLYQAKQGNLKEVRRSLAIGRNVNFRDYDNRTALHLAACHGHFDVVKYLVNHDAVITVEDRFGNTPVDEARINGHKDIEKYLRDSI